MEIRNFFGGRIHDLQAVEIAFKLTIKSICISYRDFLGNLMIKVIRKFRITESPTAHAVGDV